MDRDRWAEMVDRAFPNAQEETMTAPIGFLTLGPEVNITDVNENLLHFVAVLDKIHQQLFTHQLVITSGKDGQHAPGSLHAAGKAVDVRTDDKDDESNLVFLTVLAYAARRMPVTYFDERNLPGAPHLHIEWHGA